MGSYISMNRNDNNVDCSKCQYDLQSLNDVDVVASNGPITLKRGTRYTITMNDKKCVGYFKNSIHDIYIFDRIQFQTIKNGVVSSFVLNELSPVDKITINKNDINKYTIELYRQPNTGGKCKTRKRIKYKKSSKGGV